MVTPSAKRNSCRVAKRVGDDTQGRGAAHLNPGLGNRNSYRVAKDKRAGKSTDAGTHSTVTYSKSIVDGTPTTATLKEHKTSIFP